MVRAVVIGSGAAGLTAAAFLAREDCEMQGRSGAPHRTPFKGLWFIGSQSECGPGVWTQLMSSRNVCRTLSKEV